MTLASLMLLAGPWVRAQSPAEIAKIKNSLPGPAQQVLERLSALSTLPGGEWRAHAGNLPHGEAVDLDDSSWQSVTPGSKVPTDAVWYRRWIEVPKTLNGYDLTGSRILFRFETDANGAMPQIVYFNGRRVALGEDLEPIALFDPAKAGDKILVAVKLLQNVDLKRIRITQMRRGVKRLQTPEMKSFRGAVIRVEFSPNRPNPDDLYREFLSAAALIPSLSADPPVQKTLLEHAIGSVDLTALDQANQEAFDASLRKAQSELEPLKPTFQQANLHLTGNSHIDAAWLWPWTETEDVVERTWGTALQLMSEYPTYTYTQSAAAVQRLDGGGISGIERCDQAAYQRRPLGDCRRHVGRTRSEYARWRITSASAADRQAYLPTALWGRCAHRLEPGLFRLQLAASADLQEVGHGLLRHAEDGLE